MGTLTIRTTPEFGIVLILILMEDTLWDRRQFSLLMMFAGLNPYSNGRYSMGQPVMCSTSQVVFSLNPYSNGRYSMGKYCLENLI